ncbi:hypothetical protein RJJ63_17495 [Rhizobium hidalgonense]|uniref:hypothetical protein n=1 Tax=Rhizobium hidalgonense TaxID=1538159 RepID=UPI0028711904|nr:hypothetical protein [Rhizobium hidalgonense]MDR9821061.1 hypothetical protein [Rhizobium hidalgonense]
MTAIQQQRRDGGTDVAIVVGDNCVDVFLQRFFCQFLGDLRTHGLDLFRSYQMQVLQIGGSIADVLIMFRSDPESRAGDSPRSSFRALCERAIGRPTQNGRSAARRGDGADIDGNIARSPLTPAEENTYMFPHGVLWTEMNCRKFLLPFLFWQKAPIILPTA